MDFIHYLILFILHNFLRQVIHKKNSNVYLNLKIVLSISELWQKSRFWKFQRNMVNYIIEMLKARNLDYEIDELVKYNVLERYQMKYILETHPKIEKIRKLHKSEFFDIHTIFFGFSIFVDK